MGLATDLGHILVNRYAGRLKSAEQFEIDERYGDFLEGFEITFGPVSEASKTEYMLSACWFNKNEFNALQLIYPSTLGVWPSDRDASAAFKAIQPCLADKKKW